MATFGYIWETSATLHVSPDQGLKIWIMEEQPVNLLDFHALEGGERLHPLGKAGTALLWRALAPESDHSLLELGCGTGHTALWFQALSGARVTGADLSPQMLNRARGRKKFCGNPNNLNFVQLEAGKPLPFADQHFDAVYCESVLAIVKSDEVEFLLRELKRILKPEGKLIANESIWRETVSEAERKKVNEICRTDFGMDQAAVWPGDLPGWKKAFASSGWELESATILQEIPPAPPLPVPFRVRISNFYTLFHKIKTRLFHRKALRQVREAVQKHRETGQAIESRLLIATPQSHPEI